MHLQVLQNINYTIQIITFELVLTLIYQCDIFSDTTERGSNDRIAYTFNSATGVVTSDATIGHFNLYQPGGGFMCICPEGMQWNEWKRACEDINECEEMTDPCYRQRFQ